MFVETAPVEVSVAPLEESATREKQLASTARELSATLRRLKEECRREVRATIPADKLDAYTKIRERAKLRHTEVTNVQRHTTESVSVTARMREQIVRETKDALTQLGVDGRKIEQIRRKYGAQAQSAMEEAFGAREEAPYAEAGLPAASAALAGFQRFVPPYPNAGGFHRWDGSRGRRWAAHSADALSGVITCASSIGLNGAADSDYNFTIAHGEMLFTYVMPTTGLIEVQMTLQNARTVYGGTLWDELGWSDARVLQSGRAFLNAGTTSTTAFATLFSIQKGRNDEGAWFDQLPGGDTRVVRLFSVDVFLAGQSVNCEAGVQDTNSFWVDDMSCNTYLDSRWFVQEILVRSTGSLRNGRSAMA